MSAEATQHCRSILLDVLAEAMLIGSSSSWQLFHERGGEGDANPHAVVPSGALSCRSQLVGMARPSFATRYDTAPCVALGFDRWNGERILLAGGVRYFFDPESGGMRCAYNTVRPSSTPTPPAGASAKLYSRSAVLPMRRMCQDLLYRCAPLSVASTARELLGSPSVLSEPELEPTPTAATGRHWWSQWVVVDLIGAFLPVPSLCCELAPTTKWLWQWCIKRSDTLRPYVDAARFRSIHHHPHRSPYPPQRDRLHRASAAVHPSLTVLAQSLLRCGIEAVVDAVPHSVASASSPAVVLQGVMDCREGVQLIQRCQQVSFLGGAVVALRITSPVEWTHSCDGESSSSSRPLPPAPRPPSDWTEYGPIAFQTLRQFMEHTIWNHNNNPAAAPADAVSIDSVNGTVVVVELWIAAIPPLNEERPYAAEDPQRETEAEEALFGFSWATGHCAAMCAREQQRMPAVAVEVYRLPWKVAAIDGLLRSLRALPSLSVGGPTGRFACM